LAHAVEAEVAGFLGGHADKLTDDGLSFPEIISARSDDAALTEQA
jgi:hypothetical protein